MPLPEPPDAPPPWRFWFDITDGSDPGAPDGGDAEAIVTSVQERVVEPQVVADAALPPHDQVGTKPAQVGREPFAGIHPPRYTNHRPAQRLTLAQQQG